MLRMVAKMFFGFLLMLVISIGSAYISYLVTCNVMKQKAETEIKSVSAERPERKIEIKREEKTEDVDKVIVYDYYLVRLEGEALGIYAITDGREAFLYNESIYVNDLSDADITLLEKGVILQSPSELTGFIEDFTS